MTVADDSAPLYHDRARGLRDTAEKCRDPAARHQLLDIADQYDRLAAHADKWHHTGVKIPAPRSMAVSDRDIAHAARFCILQHGDGAAAHARSKVETMRRKGDTEGADIWLRITAAIVELGAPPGDARH